MTDDDPISDPDDSPIMFVHPDDVDLAELKGNFAAMGISIQTSPNVQRGQAYLHDPKGKGLTGGG